MKRRFMIVGGVAALAGCVSNQATAPTEGKGATPQQRIVNAAGINFEKAKALASDKRFDDARDLGFAASAATRGGALGVAGGVVSFLAAPSHDRALMTILIAELDTEEPTDQVKGKVQKTIATATGYDSDRIGIFWGKQGTANGKQIHNITFSVRKQTISIEQYVVYHEQIARSLPGLISAYVPPLEFPDGWRDPYLLRSSRKLAL